MDKKADKTFMSHSDINAGGIGWAPKFEAGDGGLRSPQSY
jgi:hypothetical protein